MQQKNDEKSENDGTVSLKDRILSKSNIYNAIYCLESYIFEKGLLDIREEVKDLEGKVIADNDLELYYALGDKFNHVLIGKVIDLCSDRLKRLLESEEDLFEIYVYFKLKSYDEEENLKFRPMHTARLTDLICMVSILICLMYEDGNKRNLSDLSKLIPHNFYGNVPSTDVQFLFKRWQTQYKEYTQNVIDHCRTYQKNHRYLTEVSLDIKNFFPSVSPLFLYDYIVDKLASTFRGNDTETLKTAVIKLLYFRMIGKNVEPWINEYYGVDKIEKVNDGEYMNRGIPQGLPQSYFFGNLCMIEVKKILMEDDMFDGDAYFYVDDSVIYVQSELKGEDFKAKINSLNVKMKAFFPKKSVIPQGGHISDKYLNFHSQIKYEIQFHTNGKSSFCHIDDAYNLLGGYENLARETSMSSNLYWNLEEIDDRISYKKSHVLANVVDKAISCLKREAAKNGECSLPEKDASRLKMLKRFKKFYLYRVRMLKMKMEETSIDDTYKDFAKRFSPQHLDTRHLDSWFETNEEEIFQSEYRLLIQNYSRDKSQKLAEEVKIFEQSILDICKKENEQKRSEYLYYQKDVTNSIAMKACLPDPYASLVRWVKENYRGMGGLPHKKQFDEFCYFLTHELDTLLKDGLWGEEYTAFVANNSSEYQRRILNAYYSESIHVLCSDACSFIKVNSKKLHYTELRILSRLRNRQFNLDDFRTFVMRFDYKDISNQMGIDMALLSVIGTFVNTVRNPEWIDGLIQTHRITKGLWYNGSKFLNSYTLHNEEHAVTLINQSVHIVKTIDYFVLKPIDYYILFLSCYLHDISMVVHPDMYVVNLSDVEIVALISNQMLKMKEVVKKFNDFKAIEIIDHRNARMKESWKFLVDVFNAIYGYFEQKVRNQHPSDSAGFVLAKSDTLLNYLEPTLLSFVAKVSASHGWDAVDVYGLKSRAKNDTVSLKYLMILIRLVDLFDVANDRINYHLLRQNLNNMPLISQFHWISHLITDKLEFDADYVITKDEDVMFVDSPITETLIVKLYLNVKYLTSKRKVVPCKGRNCKLRDKYIDIDIENNVECQATQCTLLCHWMMRKHEWLVQELVALNEYLYSVNNSLIQTRIKFQLYFSNDMDLDADLFDSVVMYLES